jgi:hypothetical protein
MAVDTVAEHTEPEPGPYDPILEAQVSAALERWLSHHTALVGEIKGILRVHIHLRHPTGTSKPEEAVRNTKRHDATSASMLDPTSHWVPGFEFGEALVVLPVALDAISLDRAAQAFNVDSSGTWLVTFILVAVAAGAMLRFELTCRDARRSCLLTAVAVAGFLALLELCTELPTAVASESLLVAFLQAAMLTTVSAGLVLCGAAILARTRSRALSHSRTAARRARQDVAHARTVQQAAYALQRHLGGLRHIPLPWAFGPATPARIDRAVWAAVLGLTIRRSFAAS